MRTIGANEKTRARVEVFHHTGHARMHTMKKMGARVKMTSLKGDKDDRHVHEKTHTSEWKFFHHTRRARMRTGAQAWVRPRMRRDIDARGDMGGKRAQLHTRVKTSEKRAMVRFRPPAWAA